jgi:hypothetical protein
MAKGVSTIILHSSDSGFGGSGSSSGACATLNDGPFTEMDDAEPSSLTNSTRSAAPHALIAAKAMVMQAQTRRPMRPFVENEHRCGAIHAPAMHW